MPDMPPATGSDSGPARLSSWFLDAEGALNGKPELLIPWLNAERGDDEDEIVAAVAAPKRSAWWVLLMHASLIIGAGVGVHRYRSRTAAIRPPGPAGPRARIARLGENWRERLQRWRPLLRRGGSADLSGADLSGADLSHRRLGGVRLRGARLGGAQLVGALASGGDLSSERGGAAGWGAGQLHPDMRRAKLCKLDLRGASLRGFDLRGADLRATRLGGADLRDANLEGARLAGASLRSTRLAGARMRGADLERTSGVDGRLLSTVAPDLRGCGLRELDLRGAKFRGFDLRGARLTGARLAGADLEQANLGRATLGCVHKDLRGATLAGLDLRGVDLRGYDLRNADLRRCNLDRAGVRGPSPPPPRQPITLQPTPASPFLSSTARGSSAPASTARACAARRCAAPLSLASISPARYSRRKTPMRTPSPPRWVPSWRCSPRVLCTSTSDGAPRCVMCSGSPAKLRGSTRRTTASMAASTCERRRGVGAAWGAHTAIILLWIQDRNPDSELACTLTPQGCTPGHEHDARGVPYNL